MSEIWKDVVGYEGLYQVSNLGRVKSLERLDKNNHPVKEKILKQACDGVGKGYLYVNLGRMGRGKIHRLVAEAFIPNPYNKPEVNHIDGNTKNNRVDNLEWVTHQENCIHYTYKLGQHIGQYKMKAVRLIRNDEIHDFDSESNAIDWIRKNTKYLKAKVGNIGKVKNRANRKMYGYKWEDLYE